MPAYIVGLEESSLLLYHINSLGMIFHIEPVTDILAIPVYRKILAMKCVVNNQWNQLLRELIRAVVIGTVRNVRRKFVGIHVCLYQHI